LQFFTNNKIILIGVKEKFVKMLTKDGWENVTLYENDLISKWDFYNTITVESTPKNTTLIFVSKENTYHPRLFYKNKVVYEMSSNDQPFALTARKGVAILDLNTV
jgi:hypothetical protein